MPAKKHVVTLTKAERLDLERAARSHKRSTLERQQPRDLLRASAGEKDAASPQRWARTSTRWRTLCDELYPAAEKIVLLIDNLNTHGVASLYAAFPPAEARRLAERLEIHHTPRHGSWLNMAEIELSVLARQCLAERMDHREHLAGGEAARNAAAPKVDWRFTTEDARIKPKHLYPTVLP